MRVWKSIRGAPGRFFPGTEAYGHQSTIGRYINRKSQFALDLKIELSFATVLQNPFNDDIIERTFERCTLRLKRK